MNPYADPEAKAKMRASPAAADRRDETMLFAAQGPCDNWRKARGTSPIYTTNPAALEMVASYFMQRENLIIRESN